MLRDCVTLAAAIPGTGKAVSSWVPRRPGRAKVAWRDDTPVAQQKVLFSVAFLNAS